MKKKILIIFTVLALLFSLSACVKKQHKALFIGSVESSDSTAVSRSYIKFEGTAQYSLKAEEDCAMKCEFTSEEGELHVIVARENKEVIYEGNISENTSFTLNVKKGLYTIILSTEEHSGSFHFELKYKE